MEGALSRKFLVVLQFSFAIILIISTIIVLRQIHYAQNRDAGYNRDNIVYSFMQGDIQKNYAMIRNELISERSGYRGHQNQSANDAPLVGYLGISVAGFHSE